MRTQFSFMLFFLCLNISSYMVIAYNIPPIAGGGIEKEKIETMAEQSGFQTVATGWNPAGLETYPILGDIVRSFSLVVNGLKAVFFGFTEFLIMIGAPSEFAWALGLIMSFMFGWFLLEFITGRGVE